MPWKATGLQWESQLKPTRSLKPFDTTCSYHMEWLSQIRILEEKHIFLKISLMDFLWCPWFIE